MPDAPPPPLRHRLPPAFVRLVTRHDHMSIWDRHAVGLLQLFLDLTDTPGDCFKGGKAVLGLLGCPAPFAEVAVADVDGYVLCNDTMRMIGYYMRDKKMRRTGGTSSSSGMPRTFLVYASAMRSTWSVQWRCLPTYLQAGEYSYSYSII